MRENVEILIKIGYYKVDHFDKRLSLIIFQLVLIQDAIYAHRYYDCRYLDRLPLVGFPLPAHRQIRIVGSS